MKSSILFLSTLFLLASCGAPETPVSLTPGAPAVQTSSSYEDLLDRVGSEVTADPQYQQCMTTSVNQCVSSTVLPLAQSTKDIQKCSLLLEESSKQNCIMMVTTIQAVAGKKVELCTPLPDPAGCRSEVISMIALDSKDPTQCQALLESPTGSGVIVGTGAIDQTQTGSVDDTEVSRQRALQHDGCVTRVIMQSGDSISGSGCDLLVQSESRTMCQQMVEQQKMMQAEREKNMPPVAPLDLPEVPTAQ